MQLEASFKVDNGLGGILVAFFTLIFPRAGAKASLYHDQFAFKRDLAHQFLEALD